MAVKRKCERLARLFPVRRRFLHAEVWHRRSMRRRRARQSMGWRRPRAALRSASSRSLDVGDDDAPGAGERAALPVVEPAPQVLAREQVDGARDDPPLPLALGRGGGEHGLSVAGAGQALHPSSRPGPSTARATPTAVICSCDARSPMRSGSPTSPRRCSTRHSLRDAPHEAFEERPSRASPVPATRAPAKRRSGRPSSPSGGASMLAPAAMEASRMVRWAASSVGRRGARRARRWPAPHGLLRRR